MNWLNIEIRLLRSAEFIGSDPTERATWLSLSGFCADQENGGVIKACADWKDRTWQQVAAVTKAEVESPSRLWSWDGPDLHVWAYPVEKEAEVAAKRAAGKSTATKRWTPTTTPPIPPKEDVKEGEGKGKEWKEMGDPCALPIAISSASSSAINGKRLHGIPTTPDEVVAYGKTLCPPKSEACCRRFFSHYEAQARTSPSGDVFWVTGGGSETVITNWRAKLSGWQDDASDASGGQPPHTPAGRIEAQKKLERYEAKMRLIRGQYADHQEWDTKDREQYRTLKAEVGTLKQQLGLIV